MSDIIIHQPNPEEHEKVGSHLVQEANSVTISTPDEWEHAGMFLNEISGRIEIIEKEFNGTDEIPGPVTLAHKAWKSGVALRERALAGLKMAKEIVMGKRRKFEFDLEQARLKEARRLQAEATQKAEEERKRQIAEAKRQGDKEAAQKLKEAHLEVSVQAPSTPEIGKVEGQRRSSPIWAWDMVNEAKIPNDLWIVNEKEISARVKRLGPKAGIPGITIYDARSRG